MDPGQVKLPTTFFPTHILPKWQAAFISGYFCTFSCKRAGDWQVILLINLCHYLLPKELGRYLANVSPRYDCSQPEETNGVSPSFFFLPDTVAAAAMSPPFLFGYRLSLWRLRSRSNGGTLPLAHIPLRIFQYGILLLLFPPRPKYKSWSQGNELI